MLREERGGHAYSQLLSHVQFCLPPRSRSHNLPPAPPRLTLIPTHLHCAWKHSLVSGFASIKGKPSWLFLRSANEAGVLPSSAERAFHPSRPWAQGPSPHPIPLSLQNLRRLSHQPSFFTSHSLHQQQASCFMPCCTNSLFSSGLSDSFCSEPSLKLLQTS